MYMLYWQEMEGDRERDERDSQLMAVRLAAISEILSLQETALTPVFVNLVNDTVLLGSL